MKKYTFKDFLDRKVNVRCTSIKEKEAFLRVCAQYGLRWNAGYKADTFMPDFDFIIMGENGRLFQSRGALGACAWFDQFVFPTTAPRYQIIIDCYGDTTTAKMIVNGKEVKTATAKRNPADKANWHIGAQTAFDRLWVKKEKPEKQKKDGVFNIGDRVVSNEKCYHEGKHGRIVFIKHSKDHDFCDIGVEFDEYVGGHECCGNAKMGHGWWVTEGLIRHEKPGSDRK